MDVDETDQDEDDCAPASPSVPLSPASSIRSSLSDDSLVDLPRVPSVVLDPLPSIKSRPSSTRSSCSSRASAGTFDCGRSRVLFGACSVYVDAATKAKEHARAWDALPLEVALPPVAAAIYASGIPAQTRVVRKQTYVFPGCCNVYVATRT
jgi:hypothetical protein